jgi:alpha-L-rhamnosidase/Glycosyl hydrolases family 2, sugar binding domain
VTPSLSDNAAEFQALLNDTWSRTNGNVSSVQPVADFLKATNIQPDFTYTKPQANTELLFVHRKLQDQDIYWVNNRNDREENVEGTFRIEGKTPELWNPQTGTTSQLSYKIENGRTIIPLHLDPFDAYFIVFKDKSTKNTVALPTTPSTKVLDITGNWIVTFQEKRGAPASATFNTLQSWTENANEGIKYFSGTASYKNSFKMPHMKKGEKYELDLGKVKDIAEVTINGKNMGILWKKPFKMDVTTALKEGTNFIEIKVTNLWVNRLIGDEQPTIKTKITYTTMPFYKATSPLLPSGLMGNVAIFKH